MRKKFIGDEEHRLPHRREAYRLWFEFLRLALTDVDLKVEDHTYDQWGDVQRERFDAWWDRHWQRLFAVETRAQEIRSSREWAAASANANRVAISIPLDCDIRGTLEDIRKLLQTKGAGLRARAKGRQSSAAVAISAVNLKYPNLRQLLRVYGYWLKSDKDVDATAQRYQAWAKQTNEKRDTWEKRRKKAGHEPFWRKVPEAGWETYVKGDADERRRAMRRYVQKARKIAANVAIGQFPGKF